VADLGVSVVTGTRWLNQFDTDTTGPVLMFVGEGGMRNTLRRAGAIVAGRGGTLGDLDGLIVCLDALKLSNPDHLSFLAGALDEHAPVLVTVDPFYLSVPGGRSADLAAMGEALYGAQQLCEEAGAALLIVPHWNKTGEGSGAQRFTGVGPSAWGRVLGSAAMEQCRTEEDGASVVTLRWEFTGSEIPDRTFRMRRRVWTADPNDLHSTMTYSVEVTSEGEAPTRELSPSQRRVVAVLERAQAGQREMTVQAIGDALAVDGQGPPLKKRTIQAALAELEEAGAIDSEGGEGRLGRYWAVAP
jgi:hypothetical protein